MLQGMVLALSVVVALLRGGSFRPLPKFKAVWLLLLAVVFAVCAAFIVKHSPVLASLSYVFTLGFLVLNWSFLELRLLLIGVAMNALVIWANGGIMPVSVLHHEDLWHGALTRHTVFPFLGDILYIRYPARAEISLGDVFIWSGTLLLIQRLLGRPIHLVRLACSEGQTEE